MAKRLAGRRREALVLYGKNDVEAVITSFNQRDMITQAVHSLCCQTIRPERIIIVDDGSTDKRSVRIVDEIEADRSITVPIQIVRQPNRGVSVARNAGIRETHTSFVLALDGDDYLQASFLEETVKMLAEHPDMAAASSWLKTFGVLEAVVRPTGGSAPAFLSRNCAPATNVFRREAWVRCGGYDETMRNGFEDWDFYLSMLETDPDACIGIVEKPLLCYRTTPISSNIKSMEKRPELMRYLMEKHMRLYKDHFIEAILGIESISMARLCGWESEIIHAAQRDKCIGSLSKAFLESPTYGDGGMAAAVRIASASPFVKSDE